MRLIFCLLFSFSAFAAPESGKFTFNFKGAEVVDVLQQYMKITGQKFVVNESVHGKITILNPHDVTAEEAFGLLSTALAENGIGISEQGDVMVVMNARNIQRDFIPVVTELPPLKPERMVSWVVETHNVDAGEVNKQLRLLTSRDGEEFPFGKNKLIISDWVSNLYRVRDLMAKLDQPEHATTKFKSK